MQKIFSSAIQPFFIASLVFLAMFSAAIFMWYTVNEKGLRYEEKLQLAASVSERQSDVQKLYRLLAETADERELIKSYFFDVVEIATFLEQIERYAIQNELLLESDRLQELATEKGQEVRQIRIPYQVEGDRKAVLDFISLLETIPYHGWLERMQIQAAHSDPEYLNASVVIVVSYIQHDRN